MTAKLTGDYFEHVTQTGDRWDLLAYRYYGDQYKQTVLIEANRHLFLDDLSVPPLVLPYGITLKIPVIVEEATNTDLLPPWKRDNPVYGGR
ncbi:tail protein X [Phyllobacterium leguminum]|uniref:Tail protein X n=1 Tax=Phyllobacterium leguminum TaxID=314237 RepID=A0A318T3U7_9HYPH|nr:tail protein X [Phyllobacterium leguminum]PYE87383.1 tail protein X [Phyllobacterium leguminum]